MGILVKSLTAISLLHVCVTLQVMASFLTATWNMRRSSRNRLPTRLIPTGPSISGLLLATTSKDITPTVSPLRIKRIALIALHTGMRKSEILKLRWEQIDLDQCLLLLSTTKSGELRGLPLNTTMVTLFREIRAEQEQMGLNSPWVFPNPVTGKPYRRDADTAWYNALEKAGLQGFHFHDLRHTTASHLRMQGADLLRVQEILGHKDLRMTARYAHVEQQHKLAAVQTLERAYQLPAPTTKKEGEPA